ncbi:acylneuraminate cytidylyltransferase family protein [Candidatus Pelagibacter sp. HIMB1509]|uniref:acylneuraminate cytidylyltransferase family protein n=1 Tax=Candidatus Pelagibacter sp. HIMB1509 TaxID=3413339 RepID=UPI003F83EE27
MKNIAFIPARAGSKRLKNKNFRNFNKIPLIEHSLKAAIDSKCYEKIIVSSDDLRIKHHIENKYKNFDHVLFIKRPKILSGDKIKVLQVINYYFEKLRIDETFETISLLLPTCPLRNSNHIKKAFEIFEKKKLDGLISITDVGFVYKMGIKIHGNYIRPFWKNSPLITGNTRSQNHKKIYRPNGGIYLSATKSFKKTKNFFKQKKIGHLIMNKIESLDVDDIDDFKLAELAKKNLVF